MDQIQKIKELKKNDLVSIYLADFKNPYQKTNCKLPHHFLKLEGEDCYECNKCGAMGGWCWKCGEDTFRRRNKVFCKSCEKEIKEFLEEELGPSTMRKR